MKIAWQKLPLGKVLTFQRGFDITKAEQQDGPYSVFSSSGAKSSHAKFKVRGPGVIIGRKGSLGTVFYSASNFWPHDTTLWVKDFHGNHPFFAYYFLQTMGFERLDAGASNPTLNRNHIHTIPIQWPLLPTQRKIAAILSAYDDLIENNLRRIKILEEMAQNLYREWFVKFRFPGHQHIRFTDSSLGPIPDGWEVCTVENTFTIMGGGTPSKAVSEYWDNGIINWYSPTDLTAAGSIFMERSGNQISELGLKKSSARLFPAFSVMMTSRATLGVISINTTEACTNQGFITCIPNERFPLYTLYYWIKENVEYFISLGTGATFKEITKGVFKTIELVVPEQSIITQFEDTVQQFTLQILNLQRKNTALRRTRDLLLPRLISGELDVSELDITIPEEAQA